MTDRLTPSPEAKVRIQRLSQKDLQDFLDEVPQSAMRALATHLPRIDGFRPGSPAGIVRQKETLARRLTRSTVGEEDFTALYMVWRTWIDQTQPNAPLVQGLIDGLEELAGKADDPALRKSAIDRGTDALLEKLKEESHQNRSTREGIERLYSFSPLPETTAARDIIASAKAAADVERDATFHNLPKRLDQDEHEIQSIKLELGALSDRVGSISTDLTDARRQLPGLQDAVREVRSVANEVRALVADKAKTQSTQEKNEADIAAVAARMKALTDESAALRRSTSELASKLETLADIEDRVRQIGSSQTQAGRAQENLGAQIAQVVAVIEAIRSDVNVLLERHAQTNRGPDVSPQSPTSSASLRCAPLFATGSAAPISSHTALAAAFANGLLSLGLRPNAARIFGEECAAAVLARQAVLLQGAFATRVASALAVAVAGPSSARLALPIGMQDGAPLRVAIEHTFAGTNEGLGALVVEGLNHAPLDITREVIKECVDPGLHQNTSHRRIVVFGTLSRGLASLGLEPEALELGPVFDLDYLPWRTSVVQVAAPQPSFLACDTDKILFAQVAETSANSEEAVRLAQALAPKRNAAVERNVVRAYQALNLVRSDHKATAPLHSLFFGWLLPYWRALGLSKEQVDSELDEGRVHGAAVDERLTAMFAAEFRNGQKGGAG